MHNALNHNRDHLELLDDVLSDGRRPSADAPNIFFHETTCRRDGVVRLNVRQACAIESAARANPESDVYVLFASPVGFERSTSKPALFRALARYGNVHLRNVNLWTYTLDTPVAEWMHRTDLFRSRYLAAHMSDMLRLVSLFKFGGTHLDLDFVVRRAFDDLAPNSAGEESPDVIENALMRFAATGVGHQIVERTLDEFAREFRGGEWSANGPQLVSRVLREVCKAERLTECTLFTVYPREMFYAVYYKEWRRLFEPRKGEQTLAAVNASVAVHFWNKLSAEMVVNVGEGSAYERLAMEFCPRVLATVGAEF